MKIKLCCLLLSLHMVAAHASNEEIRALAQAIQTGQTTRQQVTEFLNNTIRNPNNQTEYSLGIAQLINVLLNFAAGNQNNTGENTPECLSN